MLKLFNKILKAISSLKCKYFGHSYRVGNLHNKIVRSIGGHEYVLFHNECCQCGKSERFWNTSSELGLP